MERNKFKNVELTNRNVTPQEHEISIPLKILVQSFIFVFT
jgi:hypothetical protein